VLTRESIRRRTFDPTAQRVCSPSALRMVDGCLKCTEDSTTFSLSPPIQNIHNQADRSESARACFVCWLYFLREIAEIQRRDAAVVYRVGLKLLQAQTSDGESRASSNLAPDIAFCHFLVYSCHILSSVGTMCALCYGSSAVPPSPEKAIGIAATSTFNSVHLWNCDSPGAQLAWTCELDGMCLPSLYRTTINHIVLVVCAVSPRRGRQDHAQTLSII
jgi:hypothetical protein